MRKGPRVPLWPLSPEPHHLLLLQGPQAGELVSSSKACGQAARYHVYLPETSGIHPSLSIFTTISLTVRYVQMFDN